MSERYEELERIVKKLMENLDPLLYYHGSHHTFEDVIPNSEFLGKQHSLCENDMKIVKTAALFHDIGFLDQYDKNEPFGAKRAREECKKAGYSESDIERIEKCIMATQLPQNPGNDLLCQIVCDSDLGHLGRENGKFFFLRSETLRLELNEMKGLKLSPKNWNMGNLNFLDSHCYHTKIAKEVWGKGKDIAKRELKELLGIVEKSDD